MYGTTVGVTTVMFDRLVEETTGLLVILMIEAVEVAGVNVDVYPSKEVASKTLTRVVPDMEISTVVGTTVRKV